MRVKIHNSSDFSKRKIVLNTYAIWRQKERERKREKNIEKQ